MICEMCGGRMVNGRCTQCGWCAGWGGFRIKMLVSIKSKFKIKRSDL